ncbi:MAG: hypothetical protein GXP55_17470 [Deltaproteobacteria bacterium]|nr:hypothetical protein [Deltaproteobacteria bacterium]
MSEYQYYEFLAVDRRLDASEMTRLRSVSRRANITPTSLSIEYHYGGARSDEDVLLARYFDVHVYVANWGTRRLMMRLPHEVVSVEDLAPYSVGEGVDVRRVEQFTLVDLWSDTEDPEAWTEGRGWMGSLAGVRTELLRGDPRPLYLIWLHGLSRGGGEEEALEPSVPAGLSELPAALASLVEFLRIDEHLVAAAEEASHPAEPEPAGLANWIAQLPQQEKDELLLRMVQGEHAPAAAALVSRFRKEMRKAFGPKAAPRRKVADLLARAEELRESERRLRVRAGAEAQRRREEAAALARTKRLDALDARKPVAWRGVRRLVESKKPKSYDKAIELLVDLRDLAVREGDEAAFMRRFRNLRTQHARKRNFITRLGEAGLT